MGISILIPVYNYDASALIQSLAEQILSIGKKAEIIVLDDASDLPFQFTFPKNPGYSFIQLHRNTKNEGRMLARQRLAQLAQFDYLLFLDCDCTIISNDFLKIFFEKAEANQMIVSGGTIYPSKQPTECELVLHWKYGTKREKKSSAFRSNNFLIKRTVFNRLNFSIPFKEYGHEDTYWGIQFKQMAVFCTTIYNPVLHSKLDKAEEILYKADKALRNLLLLEKDINPSLLKKEIKLYRWYCRLKFFKLAGLFSFFEKPVHNFLKKNILSCKPNLFFFDLYRLANLIRLSKEKGA